MYPQCVSHFLNSPCRPQRDVSRSKHCFHGNVAMHFTISSDVYLLKVANGASNYIYIYIERLFWLAEISARYVFSR